MNSTKLATKKPQKLGRLSFWRRLLGDQRGVTTVDTIVIVGVLVLGCAALLITFKGKISEALDKEGTRLNGAANGQAQ